MDTGGKKRNALSSVTSEAATVRGRTTRTASSSRIPTSTTSRTASTTTAESRGRTKCVDLESFKDMTAEELSSWMKNPSLSVPEESIHRFMFCVNSHLKKKCNCIPQSRAYFSLANSHFKLFLIELNKFSQKAFQLESQVCKDFLASSSESAEEKSSKGQIESASNGNKVSRFDHQILPQLLNVKQQNDLLNPLVTALSFWKKGLSDNNFVARDGQLYRVHEYLTTSFYIFQFYRRLNHAYESADLSGLTAFDVKEKVVSCCLKIQVALNIADYDFAKNIVQEFESIAQEYKKEDESFNIMKTFDGIFFFLLKCDLDNRLNQGKLCVDQLRFILESEYLKAMTPNRYFLKAFAMMTITKFPGDVYPYVSASLEEFTEPVNMMYWISRRWDRDVFIPPHQKEVKVDPNAVNDPLSFRFLVYNYLFTAHVNTSRFYINTGIPLESEYYHNILMKMCRHYCSLFHARQLLVLAGNIDRMTERNKDALFKVMSAVEMLKKTFWTSMPGMDDKRDMNENECSSELDFIRSKSTTIDDEEDDENSSSPSNGCLHTRKTINVHLLKKQAMKKTLTKEVDDGEECPEIFGSKTDYFDGKPDDCPIFETDVVRAEALILLSILKSSTGSLVNDSRNRLTMLNKLGLSNNVSVSLTMIRDVLRMIPRETGSSSTRNIIIRDALENAGQLLTSRLRAMKSCIVLQTFLSVGQRSKGIMFANQFMDKKYQHRIDCLEGYSSRVQFAEFLLLYSRLMLDNEKKSSRLMEYNPAEVQEKFPEMPSSSIKVSTQVSPIKSTRSLRNRNQEPQAPKGKNDNLYDMEEMHDYFKTLSSAQEEKQIPRNQSPVPKYRQFLEEAGEIISPNNKIMVKGKFMTGKSSCVKELKFDAETDDSYGGKKKKGTLLQTPVKKSNTVSLPGSSVKKQVAETVKSLPFCGNIITEVQGIVTEDDIEKSHQMVLIIKKYLGSHPPVDLHKLLHSIISDYYFCRKLPETATQTAINETVESAVYSLTETVSASFRYFAIKTFARRERKKSEVKFDRNMLNFNSTNDSFSSVVERALSFCPNGSRIVQIQVDPRSLLSWKQTGPDLLVTRFEKGKSPVFLRIVTDVRKHKKNFLNELTDIIEASDHSIKEKDPATFWSLRKALDRRMAKLLEGVESAWFGPFIGFFFGKIPDALFRSTVVTLVEDLSQIASKFASRCIDTNLLKVFMEATPVLSEENIFHGLAFLFNCYDIEFLNEALRKIQSRLNPIVHDKKDNYPVRGEHKEKFKEIYTTKFHSLPVGLIIGHGLEVFPWESLPTLTSCRDLGFFRIPSIRFLSISMELFIDRTKAGEDESQTYYLLNPTGDLTKTEKRFGDRFLQSFGSNGCQGSAPRGDQLKSALEDNDIYIFFGHGAGSIFYRNIPDNLEGTALNTCSLVIGCSSGSLRFEGKEIEANGTAYRFLVNGCPSYVGVLWNVTDGDIDTYADNMLQVWMPKTWSDDKTSGVSLPTATSLARTSCKLRYLTGAATVIYGLPLFCRQSRVYKK